MTAKLIRSIALNNYGTADMLRLLGTFENKDTDPAARQTAIDYLVRLHNIDLSNTKSLRYDAGFKEKDGRNVKGVIRIGPGAFLQDAPWLANVVFHETVHSDQFLTYDQQGVGTIDPRRSEPERILVALDEYEAFYWAWFNRRALGVSKDQIAALERELSLWQIDIDDKATVEFARKAQFDTARLALIARIPAAGKQTRATPSRSTAAYHTGIRPLSPGRTCCGLFA